MATTVPTEKERKEWEDTVRNLKTPQSEWAKQFSGVWQQLSSWDDEPGLSGTQRICIETYTFPNMDKPTSEFRALPPYAGRLIKMIDEKSPLPSGENPCFSDFPLPRAQAKEPETLLRILWVLKKEQPKAVTPPAMPSLNAFGLKGLFGL